MLLDGDGATDPNNSQQLTLHVFVRLGAGGPGLHDPCEKEPTDTLASMTEQQAEAVTFSAQVHTRSICADVCPSLSSP